MRPLRIFTVVYGGHVDWFLRGLVKSLLWPKNKAALQQARWSIWGNLDDTQRIYEIATQLIPFHQIEFRQKVITSGGVDLLSMMMQTMRKCADERVPMLTAPPDTIFSDGAIETLLAYGEQKETCVAVPHPRVLPEIMNEIQFGRAPTNGELVTMALEKYPHACWTTAEYDRPVSGTSVGGICWQKVADKTYAVQHRLPTVYLANFIEDDRKFFSRPWKNVPPQYGMWDHEWPGAELFPECRIHPPTMVGDKERMRTIGCSDAAFICECTEHWKNIPTQRVINPNDKDAFHRDENHNRINRQYLTCFRGD